MHPSLPGFLPVLLLTISKSRPHWLLFVLGMASIVPVGLASIFVIRAAASLDSPAAQIFTIAFAGSSMPEELVRFAVLYYVGMRWFGIERPRDGLIFGLLVSFGFSVAENIFYAVSIGWATGALKLAIATPIHLALGVTMGCLLAVAAGSPEKRRTYTFYAVAAPMLMHGVYDLILLTALTNNGPGVSAVARLALPAVCFILIVATAILAVMRSRPDDTVSA